ncbi:IS630 family transposase [Salinibacter ruber]|uniref:IS630 family transposase n=1 Tax=Salinibacter ruber TaxID=146919 RepID=UPI002168363C|nr:IS630 family transposase [Salinibacter ruber]
MPNKKYRVELTKDERSHLLERLGRGERPAAEQTRVRALLKVDEGTEGPAWTDARTAEALEVAKGTVAGIRRRFCERGLTGCVERKSPAREYDRKLDGEQEAELIRLACSEAPEGRSQWSLRLLADEMVELGVVEDLSHETVRQTLKKNRLKPHRSRQWVIPPEQSANFVAKMTGVLSVYKRPYDPERPVVCMDEMPRQLIREVRTPLPMEAGKPKRHDYHYERNGVVNLFMFFEPLAGWRTVMVRERRTKVDWAYCMRQLLEEHYPEAQQIVLVMDNLNTHGLSSFYEAFAPEEACRLAQRLEIHYTPEHGSWLNMAEIENSAMARQCLSRRIPKTQVMEEETSAWSKRRNEEGAAANWRFRTEDARIKLRRLYPNIDG